MPEVAQTAYVDQQAQIANDVIVGHNCYVGPDVIIGPGCTLHNNVTITGNTCVGAGNTFFQNAVIGTIPQDLKFAGEKTTAEIGDNTTLREYATINRGTKAKDITKIGANCLISFNL